MRKWIILILAGLAITASPWRLAHAAEAAAGRQITGTARDVLGRPLAKVSIHLRARDGRIAARTQSDAQGHFTLTGMAPGTYALEASKGGFKPATAIVTMTARGKERVTLSLEPKGILSLKITATRLRPARNALSAEGASVYRFSPKTISQLPQGENSTLKQVLLQAPGVSQDTYGQGQGQIHIHGENGGGIQYRINGIYMPAAVSSFGEIFAPRFVRSITLLTGVLPTQFGFQTEGVVDIRTKTGCADSGASAELYGGQRATIQPSFEVGGCHGRFGYFLSGFYLQDNLGLQSPSTAINPKHDRTNQGQEFGYFSYRFNSTTRLSLITGTAVNYFQIPPEPGLTPQYQMTGATSYPSIDVAESELEQNYFAVLALHGSIGDDLDYDLAGFSRYYSLAYDPDPVGDLIYNGIAAHILHTGFINGLQADASYRINRKHTLRAGLYASGESIELDDHALAFPADSSGQQASDVPIQIVDDHPATAWLFGIYAQDQWRPLPKLKINFGTRWDFMSAFTTENQLSPRVNAEYALTPDTTLHAGYARYFEVPPFEAVLPETLAKFENTTGASEITGGNPNVKPEESNYFEIGLRQRLPPGLMLGVDGFYKMARNKLDLAQFGNTLVFAPLNYRKAEGWGADFSATYERENLSSYFNFSYAVLKAKDISAGQFLADDPEELAYVANHWIILDDSQEFTISYGTSYLWRGFEFSVDGIWGSGYRAGFANLMNLTPTWQVNLGVTRSFTLPRIGRVRARASLMNLFDNIYQIRNGTGIGVFAPQYGPRRAVYFGLRVPFHS